MTNRSPGLFVLAALAGACAVVTDDEAVETTEQALANGTPAPVSGPNGWRIANVDGQCSGTVIDPWWVLTARHCLDGNKDPSWIDIGLDGQGRDVTHVYLHPDHLNGENGVDVMMLRLASPFTNIPATEVPIYAGDTDALMGKTVFCGGYGGTVETVGATGGWFTVIDDGNYNMPDRFYRLQEPNALGQDLIDGDSGGSCRLATTAGYAVTGVHKGAGQTSAEAFHTWAESRRDCPGFDPNDLSTGFCSAACPCDVGEGDCDSNAQCQPGLYCRPADVGNGLEVNYSVCDRIPSPTCDGAFDPDDASYNFCRVSADEDCTCAHGEGDCDMDFECGGSLECQVNSGYAVGLPSSYGICVYPVPPSCPHYEPSVDDVEFCSVDCPCDLGQGDCDSDTECRGGLVCQPNIGAQFTKPSYYGICVRP
jgi:hypothetical protein